MIFTDTERCILESTKKDYKWIARDKDGDLYLYVSKPYRFVNRGVFDTGLEFDDISSFVECFSDNIFSNVTWENSPIQFRDSEPLTPKESEYLKFVFRPFASDIAYVRKLSTNNSEYIWVYIWNGRNAASMTFPVFEKGTMYKGMKLKKSYTLKELGIKYDE